MFALETRAVNNRPKPLASDPFHPETHQAFDKLNVVLLPNDELRRTGTNWIPTGFVISGDQDFVGKMLKERFFHNPSVGYTFRVEDGMIVEYEFQAKANGEFPVGQ